MDITDPTALRELSDLAKKGDARAQELLEVEIERLKTGADGESFGAETLGDVADRLGELDQIIQDEEKHIFIPSSNPQG